MMRIGLCWLFGKSSRISLCAGRGWRFSSLVAKVKSGVYALCHLAEKKAPLSFGWYSRCKLFKFAQLLIVFSSIIISMIPPFIVVAVSLQLLWLDFVAFVEGGLAIQHLEACRYLL